MPAQVLRLYLSNVKIRAKKDVSSECQRCNHIQEKMATTKRGEQAARREERTEHRCRPTNRIANRSRLSAPKVLLLGSLLLVACRKHYRGQKKVYQKIVQLVAACTYYFLSCVLDGMDQVLLSAFLHLSSFASRLTPHALRPTRSPPPLLLVQWKTYCPHLPGRSNEQPGFRLKQKITGVFLHGLLLAFYVTFHWTESSAGEPNTSSLTLNVPFDSSCTNLSCRHQPHSTL
jgi:hypothetical protein